jgi:hypothetical protein
VLNLAVRTLNTDQYEHPPLQYLSRFGIIVSVLRTGDRRGECRVLVGRPEGKRPPGRRRRIWEDSIKMDLKEVGW